MTLVYSYSWGWGGFYACCFKLVVECVVWCLLNFFKCLYFVGSDCGWG